MSFPAVEKSSKFRFSIVAVALTPLVLAGGALALQGQLDTQALLLIVGAGSAVITGALLWVLSAPVARLTSAVGQFHGARQFESLPLERRDELGFIAYTIDQLSQQLAARQELSNQVQQWVQETSKDIPNAQVSVGKQLNTNNSEPSLDAALNEYNKAVFHELNVTRQRLNLTARILNSLASPAVTIDENGIIRLMNTSCEEMFQLPRMSWQKKSITDLFSPNPAEMSLVEDPNVNVCRNSEVMEWLQSNETSTLAAIDQGNRIVRLSKGTPFQYGKEKWFPVSVREISSERESLAQMLVQARGEMFRQVTGRWLNETRSTLQSLAPVVRGALDSTKKSADRATLLPKVSGISRMLNELTSTIEIMDWFATAFWSEIPAPGNREFIAAEVVQSVGVRLESRFFARDNSLKIINQGGWMCFDEEWLKVMVGALLIHACESVKNSQIEVRIGRAQAGTRDIEPPIEFTIPDAGPLLQSNEMQDLQYPLGGLRAPSLDYYSTGGFPQGLILVSRLSEIVGGELKIEESASKRLQLKLVLPALLPAVIEEAEMGEFIEVGPIDELCVGWKLAKVD
ncbi:MAG: PAS domain-containing protein [Zavarzinella sp.]